MKRIMVITIAFAIVCGTAFAGSASATQPQGTSHAWIAWAKSGLSANSHMTYMEHAIWAYGQDYGEIPGYFAHQESMAIQLSSDAILVAATADSPSSVLNRALIHEAIDYNRIAWDIYQAFATRKPSFDKLARQELSPCRASENAVINDIPLSVGDLTHQAFEGEWLPEW